MLKQNIKKAQLRQQSCLEEFRCQPKNSCLLYNKCGLNSIHSKVANEVDVCELIAYGARDLVIVAVCELSTHIVRSGSFS